MLKEVRHSHSFRARDEEGVQHLLHVYVEILDAGVMGDPAAEAEGLRQIRTVDGRPVNRLEWGRYQVVGSGDVLTSSDPEAP